MNPQGESARRGRESETAFWAAATLGVPLLLSAALLLALLLEMGFTAFDVHGSRFIAVGIVEVLIASGLLWSARKAPQWAAGVRVAGTVVGVIVLAGAMVTL